MMFFFSDTKRQKYIEYMEVLENEISINSIDDDIMGIESKDYESIIISEEDHRKYIDFYRKMVDNPIKREYINKNRFFLIIRDSGKLIVEGGREYKIKWHYIY